MDPILPFVPTHGPYTYMLLRNGIIHPSSSANNIVGKLRFFKLIVEISAKPSLPFGATAAYFSAPYKPANVTNPLFNNALLLIFGTIGILVDSVIKTSAELFFGLIKYAGSASNPTYILLFLIKYESVLTAIPSGLTINSTLLLFIFKLDFLFISVSANPDILLSEVSNSKVSTHGVSPLKLAV